jgi:uncharacterized protein YndB with AHSA1/START domain
MVTDRLQREITIKAPVERVWAVITEAQHLGAWFGNGGEPAKVDFRPGGNMLFDHGEHGMRPARIEQIDAPRYFAYRWLHDVDQEPTSDNSTLVEFTLRPDGDGTLLKVTESGFATLALDEAAKQKRVEMNTGGWQAKTEELAAYAEKLPV